MNPQSSLPALRVLPLAWALSLVLITTIFTLGIRISGAQSADTDADGYADEVEEELGSNPENADSTPEHFSLLWSCTDGNDNDKDGTKDFADAGCRVAGSPAPTPAATQTPAPTATPGTGGGSGSGGGSSSDDGGTSSSSDNGSSTGDTSDSDTGANTAGTSDTSSDGGAQDSGAGIGAAASTSGTDGGSTIDSSDAASSGDDGSGSGFPWMLLLLILAAIVTAAAISYALLARKKARMRSYKMTKP